MQKSLWSGRRLITGLAVILFMAGCAGGSKKLPEAYFDIPVYEPSEVKYSMGSTSGGDGFVVKGMGWDLSTSDSPEKVIAWYKKKLPQADKTESEEGETTFTYHPKGAEEHESVQIVIKKGEFHIMEDVLPGKRK